MPKENRVQTLVEEIGLFINYAVPEEERKQAASLVRKHEQDRPVLTLLREYYATLPEAREEGVQRIVALARLQGVFLFIAITRSEEYLYVVSEENVVFLGDYGSEVDEQILSYFGYESQSAFLKNCLPVGELDDYEEHLAGENLCYCSACGVAEGEHHLLGCVVEVCPWCDGQLSNCNCRFEQLDIDAINTEEQLDDFYDLLREKGRVLFQKNQSPFYPGAGEGLDKIRKK